MAEDAGALALARRRGMDPGTSSALLMRLLGTADPSVTQPVLREGFLTSITDPVGAERFAQERQSAALDTSLASRGVSRGAGADQERLLLALQQQQRLAQVQPRGGMVGGDPIPGIDFDIPQPIEPQPTMSPGVRPRTNFDPVETPQVDPRSAAQADPRLRALASGVRAARLRASAQATDRSQLRTGADPTGEALGMGSAAAPGLGTAFAYSPEVAAAWASRFGDTDLTSPAQAFLEAEAKVSGRMGLGGGVDARRPRELAESILASAAQAETARKRLEILQGMVSEGRFANAGAPGTVAAREEIQTLRRALAENSARADREYAKYEARLYRGGTSARQSWTDRRQALARRVSGALQVPDGANGAKGWQIVSAGLADHELERLAGAIGRGEDIDAIAMGELQGGAMVGAA